MELALAALAFVAAALLLPLLLWERWLRRRTAAPRYAARLTEALLGLGALTMMFAMVSAVQALRVVRAEAFESGAEKARVLAEAIAEAMNCGALLFLIALVVALWLLFATWRWHWHSGKAAR
jgi:hypothetical protein